MRRCLEPDHDTTTTTTTTAPLLTRVDRLSVPSLSRLGLQMTETKGRMTSTTTRKLNRPQVMLHPPTPVVAILLLGTALLSHSRISCRAYHPFRPHYQLSSWTIQKLSPSQHGTLSIQPLSEHAPRTAAITSTQIFLKAYNQDFDFKEFDIDDILSEAEDALKVAENSLNDEGSGSSAAAAMTESTAATKSSSSTAATTATTSAQASTRPVTRPTIELNAENLKNTIASTMGGVLFGSILGSIATFQFPDLASAFDDNSSIFIFPILGAITLGVVGAIGGSQNNAFGTITRGILGAPILQLVSSLQYAAARQVEKTTNEIKALPQNLANSAQQRVQSTVSSAVEEVTSLPRKARDKVVENVKNSVHSAVEEVTSIPRKAVENVKALPQKAKESLMDSSDVVSKDFRLELVLLPIVIALAFLLLDAMATGRLVPSSL